jgi:hypothetical protein
MSIQAVWLKDTKWSMLERLCVGEELLLRGGPQEEFFVRGGGANE